MSFQTEATGDRRHGEPDAGKPIKVGAKANAEEPTAVSEDQRVDIGADLKGNQRIVGNVAHDSVDSGNPIKVGGVGRSANPSKVGSGDRVNSFLDLVGRLVVVLQQCRDLVAVNNITLSNGTETTLLAAGGVGVFHDAVLISGANNSNAAVTVDIRDATAGTVKFSLDIPASGTQSMTFQIPYPQTTANGNWTVDMADITGTNVKLLIQAIKNV